MKKIKENLALLTASLLTIAVVAALLIGAGLKRSSRHGDANDGQAPQLASVTDGVSGFSWAEAVKKVKEDRGEPTGKQAKVETPRQLRHYSDTRRFLAVQVAEWREHRFDTPHDFVDLAAMIRSGEMVQLQPVSPDYILLGVGGSADKEPFTRYENGKRITLYNEAELNQEYARIGESRANLEDEINGLKRELDSLNKRERSARARLQSEIREKEKSLKAELEAKDRLDRYYGDSKRREQLFGDYASLESLAKDFSGRAYTLDDARSRQEMKVRMLSSLRPQALKVLEEIAAAYHEHFYRPLPVTSLVRPDEYQYALSKVNPNAVRIETPPHSTGLAFDVYYRFMTAEEQAYVMAYLARLKDEGRIEVLRENRDHYHVFAFVDGTRPDEAFIAASLGKTKSKPAEAERETQLGE